MGNDVGGLRRYRMGVASEIYQEGSSGMTTVQHEYAGFHYMIDVDAEGKAFGANPLIGQHKAASKDKDRRAAITTYNQERKK